MNTEEMRRAAGTMESAAEEMRRASGQFEDSVFRLEKLLGQAYGSNIDRLIETLENLKAVDSQEEKLDRRPEVGAINGPGYKVIIDENRSVFGAKTERGVAFRFTSYGIATHIALTNDAFIAALQIVEALHASPQEQPIE